MSTGQRKTKAVVGVVSAIGALAAGATITANADTVQVKAGDTVWALSQKLGVSIQDLEKQNSIDSSTDMIFVGQKLQVKSSQSKKTITVKSGDTLWDLAQAYHVSVAQLQAANHLSGDMLSVGQQLTLPTGAAKAATDTTTTPAATSTTQQKQSTAKANAVQAQIVAEQQAAAAKQQKQQAASVSQSSSSTATTSSSTSARTENHTRAAVAETTPVSQSSASQNSQSQTSQASSNVASQSSVSQQSRSSQVQQAQPSQQQSQTSQQTSVSQPASSSQTQQTTQTGSQNATATSQTKRIKTTTQSAVKKQASQASQSTTTTSSSSSSSAQTNTNLSSGSVTGLALKLASANIPYVWGGSSLSGMDCSGLVAYVYKNALGVNLPHNTVSQEAFVTKHSVGTAKPGDILFWGNSGATYHDAIYLGNNQFVAAPEPGDNVKVQQISKYFMPSFAGTLK
ncbi:LysM peptidoglycan-binding domain-containing protein [Levilactobacillus huananensis]|uniref:LysM peptidoglycan-binding domain-containing protein n=1 Tax=Levilactobacillus huananensis TaxID=2486019 RepID=UPI000F7B8BF2|nr:LysM peptidoglycan-binding domain-containing protein [Levilactobacillus huananensis]